MIVSRFSLTLCIGSHSVIELFHTMVVLEIPPRPRSSNLSRTVAGTGPFCAPLASMYSQIAAPLLISVGVAVAQKKEEED